MRDQAMPDYSLKRFGMGRYAHFRHGRGCHYGITHRPSVNSIAADHTMNSETARLCVLQPRHDIGVDSVREIATSVRKH